VALISVDCGKCGASISSEAGTRSFLCQYCGTRGEISPDIREVPSTEKFATLARKAIDRGEYGKAVQLCEEGFKLDPSHKELLEIEEQARAAIANMSTDMDGEVSKFAEAENYHNQASSVLSSLQINNQVYGSNSALTGATPANVDLGLKYVDRSLELFPENAIYLNTKALLLSEGKNDKVKALALLEKAHKIAPRDINIEQNLATVKSSGCFVATAAMGSSTDPIVVKLRAWRDGTLTHTKPGRQFIAAYYRACPRLVPLIDKSPARRAIVRFGLRAFVRLLKI